MKHYAPGSFNMIDKDGKEYFLTVEQDDYAENPRDMYDNISTIYCWHTYYIIGDDKPKEKTARDVLADMCEKYTNMEADDIDAASENDMIRELQQAKDIVIKYISCYEHSGITISTAITTYPYNDRWDSGIIGFAFIDDEEGVALQDIVLVRANEKGIGIVDDVNIGTEVLVWADEDNEDYTHKFKIDEHDFEEE